MAAVVVGPVHVPCVSFCVHTSGLSHLFFSFSLRMCNLHKFTHIHSSNFAIFCECFSPFVNASTCLLCLCHVPYNQHVTNHSKRTLHIPVSDINPYLQNQLNNLIIMSKAHIIRHFNWNSSLCSTIHLTIKLKIPLRKVNFPMLFLGGDEQHYGTSPVRNSNSITLFISQTEPVSLAILLTGYAPMGIESMTSNFVGEQINRRTSVHLQFLQPLGIPL